MITHGDCLDVMAAMEPESVDAVVTDPPYGLGFMGKAWDNAARLASVPPSAIALAESGRDPYPKTGKGPAAVAFDGRAFQSWCQRWAEAAYRVAKPSAYLLAFGGTRTVHRMAVAIEDAGWIIRDMLVWAYASGFPKSKASLKPAWEPIVMARKPGPLRMLRIDECRIGTDTMPELPGELGAHGVYGRMVRRSASGPTRTMDEWDDDASLCDSCAEDADSPERPGTSGTRGSTTPRRAEQQPNGSETRGDTSRAATGCSHGMTPGNGASSSSTDESGRVPTGLFLPGSLSTISTRTSSTIASRICTCCGGPITRTTTSATRSDTETEPPAPTTSGSTASVGRWPSNVLLTDPIFDGGVDGVVGGGEAGGSPLEWGRADRTEYGATTIAPRTAGERFVGYGDSGTYSRFFQLPRRYNETCQECGRVSSAEPPSSLPNRSADSAPSHAQTGAFGESSTTMDSAITNATAIASLSDDAANTPAILRSRRLATSPESGHPSSHAKSPAAASLATGTTMTTAVPWTCGTCAEATTLAITSPSPESRNYPFAFLIPKADRGDREPVLGGLPERDENFMAGLPDPRMDRPQIRNPRANHHPTVKPTELMRHLVRLVTPAGGTVLDPFLGSGTTGLACELEGFPWIGIERELEYVQIAEARLNGTQRGFGLDVPAPTPKPRPVSMENTTAKRASYGRKAHDGSTWRLHGHDPVPAPVQEGSPVVSIDPQLLLGMAGPAEGDEVA